MDRPRPRSAIAALATLIIAATLFIACSNGDQPAAPERCPWDGDDDGQPTASTLDCYYDWASRRAGTEINPTTWSLTATHSGPIRIVVISGPGRADRADLAGTASKTATTLTRMTGQIPAGDFLIVDGAGVDDRLAGAMRDGAAAISPIVSHADSRRWVAAHETSHLWWQGNVSWIDEGLAEVTASIVTGKKTPPDLVTACRWNTIYAWLFADPGMADTECATTLGAQAMTYALVRDENGVKRRASQLVSGNEAQRASATAWFTRMAEESDRHASKKDK